MCEFWDMTPRETISALDAAAWRMRQEQALMLSLAWHVAAFSRTRRLPALAGLLNRLKPRKHEPIEKRREEFEEMKERMSAGVKGRRGAGEKGRRGEGEQGSGGEEVTDGG